MKRYWIPLPAIVLLLAAGGAAWAQPPSVTDIYPVNVTTRSFTVIWQTDQPATADLEVYGDVLGTATVTATITPHPVLCGNTLLAATARNLGVMSVQVTGLDANTTYYYRTRTISKDDAAVTEYPAPGDLLLPVTTEARTVRATAAGVPFSNDVMIRDFFMADGITPADGTIVFASCTGCDYPLAAVVGDCVGSGDVLIDLNNVFDRQTGENLDLTQGVTLNLVNFRGSDGATQVVHEVPADNNLAEIKTPDPGLKPGWNMVSIQVDPADPATTAVLAPLSGDVNSIWEYGTATDSWQQFDFTLPPDLWFLNDLQTLSGGGGYWLDLLSGGSLAVQGTPSRGPTSLLSGWNLTASKGLEAMEVVSAFPADCTINSVWNYDNSSDSWRQFDFTLPPPLWFLNDLTYIEPGKAYWVDAAGACSW